MKWKLIRIVEGFKNYNIVDWGKAIEVGYLIFFPSPNHLRIIPIDDIDDTRDKIFSGNNSFYYIVDESLFVNIDSQLYGFDFNLKEGNLICETKEERIRILNKRYALGTTHSLKPPINKNVIIRNEDCSVVHNWDDRSYLVGDMGDDIFLFQAFEDDKLKCIDIGKQKTLWEKDFNKRIGPSRFYKITEDRIITQDTRGGVTILQCLDNSSGGIFWDIENSLSYYNYDVSTQKLYGLGRRTFEIIDVDTGEREMCKGPSENLHISSHLTYYNNGLMYFSGYRDNNVPIFGAVNIEDGNLWFSQEVEMPGEKSFRKGLGRPIIIGNRLYVRDVMKTLHIYEREDHFGKAF